LLSFDKEGTILFKSWMYSREASFVQVKKIAVRNIPYKLLRTIMVMMIMVMMKKMGYMRIKVIITMMMMIMMMMMMIMMMIIMMIMMMIMTMMMIIMMIMINTDKTITNYKTMWWILIRSV